MVVLIVAALWCAISVPVALGLGRVVGAPTAELLGVHEGDVVYLAPDGCVARVSLVPVNR